MNLYVKIDSMATYKWNRNFLLFNLLICNVSNSKKNKSVVNQIMDLVLLENDDVIKKYINKERDLSTSVFDILTLGTIRLPYNILTHVAMDYTDVFVSSDNLEKYAIYQRDLLLNFFSEMEAHVWNKSNTKESFETSMKMFYNQIYGLKYDIIKNIGIDFLVFGNRNKTIEENFYILENYINNFFIQRIINLTPKSKDKLSLSNRFKRYAWLYSLNFTLNSYIIKIITNLSFAGLGFFTNSSDPNNILSQYSEEGWAQLIGLYKEVQETIKSIEEQSDESKLKEIIQAKLKNPDIMDLLAFLQKGKKLPSEEDLLPINLQKESERNRKLFETLTSVQKYGLWLPFHLTFRYFGSVYRFFLKSTNKAISFFQDNEDYKYSEFINFRNKNFPNTNGPKPTYQLIQEMEQDDEIQSIIKKRNKFLIEEAKFTNLMNNKIILFGHLLVYGKSYLDKMLNAKVTDISLGLIVYLTSKSIKIQPAYPEELLISSTENIHLEEFLNIATEKILQNKPIPHLIIQVPSFDIQNTIKSIIYEIFSKKQIVFHVHKIINPIALTKVLVEIQGQSMSTKSTFNESKTVQDIFNRNVKSLKTLLEVYFLGEKYNYLSWFGKVYIESLRIFYKLERGFLNIDKINKKLVTLIEIESMEYLCGKRGINGTSPYALCSLIYMELMNTIQKGVTVIAYTESIKSIDPAVLSRIDFQVEFDSLQEMKNYIIVVRKYLLELMLISPDLVDFENMSFEEALWNISRTLYSSNYDMELIEKIFTNLQEPKIIEKFEKKIKFSDIMNIIKQKNGGV